MAIGFGSGSRRGAEVRARSIAFIEAHRFSDILLAEADL